MIYHLLKNTLIEKRKENVILSFIVYWFFEKENLYLVISQSELKKKFNYFFINSTKKNPCCRGNLSVDKPMIS